MNSVYKRFLRKIYEDAGYKHLHFVGHRCVALRSSIALVAALPDV